jgi:hypothetical protein
MSIDDQNHYNTKIKKCLILIEKEASFSGDKFYTNIFLFDAFERREYATWTWASDKIKKY